MSVESEARKASPFVILDSNSQRVFFGQLISQTCDKLMSVGLIWVLTTRFDPKWVPWFIGLGALPHLLFASQSGHFINRLGALKTVIWSDAVRGFLFLAAAIVVSQAQTDPLLLALLLVTTLISNVFGSLFNPAILTLPVDMLPPGAKRDKLTALIDSCFSFGNVLGPLVSVAPYATVGLSGMLALNGVSYLFSAALARGIKLSAPQTSQEIELTDHNVRDESFVRDGKEGPEQATATAATATGSRFWAVAKSEPVISGMLVTFLLMNFFLAPLMMLMPWYAKNIYLDGIQGLAKLEVCLAAGTVIGSTLLSFVQVPGALWKRVSASLLLMALAYLGFTSSHNLVAGCLSVGILGFFLAVANIVILTFFQSHSEPKDVPVVMGMVNLISVASLPISMGIVGAVIDKIPVENFANICAILVITIALYIGFIPRIKTV